MRAFKLFLINFRRFGNSGWIYVCHHIESTKVLISIQLFLMTVETNVRLLGSAEFGATAVIGDDSSCHVATTNGFSATSSVAHMLGGFSKLMSLNHPHLCKYVEFVRSAVRMFYILVSSIKLIDAYFAY